MILGAMQPYFIPHKSYFDLVQESDLFVVMDTLPISNRKWVKGNFFTLENRRQWFSIPLRRHEDYLPINLVEVHDSFSKNRVMDRFDQSKHKHPNWSIWKPVLEEYLNFQDGLLVSGLISGFDAFMQAASLKTEWYSYSELDLEKCADRSVRIASLCRALGATTYLNNESGVHLYDERVFDEFGVELKSFTSKERLGPNYPEVSLSYLEKFVGGDTRL